MTKEEISQIQNTLVIYLKYYYGETPIANSEFPEYMYMEMFGDVLLRSEDTGPTLKQVAMSFEQGRHNYALLTYANALKPEAKSMVSYGKLELEDY